MDGNDKSYSTGFKPDGSKGKTMGVTRHSTTSIYQFKELEYNKKQFGWYSSSFHNRHVGSVHNSHPYTTIFNLDTGDMTISSPPGSGVRGGKTGSDFCTASAGYAAKTLGFSDQDGDAGFADDNADPWFFFLGYNYNYEWFFEDFCIGNSEQDVAPNRRNKQISVEKFHQVTSGCSSVPRGSQAKSVVDTDPLVVDADGFFSNQGSWTVDNSDLYATGAWAQPSTTYGPERTLCSGGQPWRSKNGRGSDATGDAHQSSGIAQANGNIGYDQNQWIAYDLQQEILLNQFKMDMPSTWPGAAPDNFELQYGDSLDGPWTAALTAQHPGDNVEPVSYSFSAIKARYWRLYMHDEHGYGYIHVQYVQFGNSNAAEGTYDELSASLGGSSGSGSSGISKPGAPDFVCWGGSCNSNFTNGCECPLAPPAEGTACEWRVTYFRGQEPAIIMPSVTLTRSLGYAGQADDAVHEIYSNGADVAEAVIKIVANAESTDVLGLKASLTPLGVAHTYSVTVVTDELTGVQTPVPVLKITPVPGSGQDVVPEAAILYALRAVEFSVSTFVPSKETRELAVSVTYVDGQRTTGKAFVMFARPVAISNLHGSRGYKPTVYSEEHHLAHAFAPLMRRIEVTGPDLVRIDEAEVTIVDGFQDGDELAVLKPHNNVHVSFSNTTRTLSLNGVGSVEDYRSTVADVGFRSSSCAACTKPRKVRIRMKGRGQDYWSNSAYAIVYLFDLCGTDGRWGSMA
jgi:hypothetical protein